MKLPLINSQDAAFSLEILKKYYDKKLIPAEKKNYLSRLRDSKGPYMAMVAHDGSTHYMLDAASQIATLGHGFNPSVFFGALQFEEAWTNDSNTKDIKNLRNVFATFFKRKLNWKNAYTTYVHSGAEANETALGYAYRKRHHKQARKVLAFEGSFHGRMLVTLAATWNKSKREPFEWQNYLAEYVPYPSIDHSEIVQTIPANWREFWSESGSKKFARNTEWDKNLEIKKEVDSLLSVREKLLTKEIFAIIVEPMQCEGGDCYSTNRFHTALLLMARAFKAQVIFDEVQTGFHLGKEFFWHRQLDLRDVDGSQLNPDYVTCAKKSQIGLVLSHSPTKNIFKGEEFSIASLLRGYAHAISLDQAQLKIHEIEKKASLKVEELIQKNPEFLSKKRVNGLAFAFDIHDPKLLNKFIDLRFKHGLLYYPAGDKTLRFRLNTAFTDNDLNFLFDRLDAICLELFKGIEKEIPSFVETENRDQDDLYDWHELLINNKLNEKNAQNVLKKSEEKIKQKGNFNLVEITGSNFLKFRSQIIDLQKIVYEPARQTDIEKFEHTVLHPNSLCLGVLENETLVAIAFAGPLSLYPLERGVRNDPYFKDEDVLYMLDLTVHPKTQSTGLGRMLKYTLQAHALSKGIKRIHGRNRDRLASAMLNINLSLGAIELQYMKEDYPDFEDYRDVFYYTTSTTWHNHPHRLGHGIDQPITKRSLDENFVKELAPFLVNKVCLSNFVSTNFLDAVKDIFQLMPETLRHGFTCSGQSEATDKVVKTLWVKSSDENKAKSIIKQLTFKDHFFGHGSNFSRSLSIEDDPYFPSRILEKPTTQNFKEVLKAVETEFKTTSYMAVWVEPILQRTMERTPLEFLVELKKLANQYNVKLVFNETGSQAYRFNDKSYFALCDQSIVPDAGLVYLGGQAALAFCKEEYFLDAPLMMISTWDGDEFSMLLAHKQMKSIQANIELYKKTCSDFQKRMIDKISEYDLETIQLQNGRGFFKGSIPDSLAKYFKFFNHHYIVNPSFDAMLDYLEQTK